jgi:hypothetical protein
MCASRRPARLLAKDFGVRCHEGLQGVGKTGTRIVNMKNNPTLHDKTNLINGAGVGNRAVRLMFKLGLDVDLRTVVVTIQCERGTIAPAQKFSRGQLITWVKEKIAAGQAVQTVYECCGFGYTLHEDLQAAGARSIVTTPMRLSLGRRLTPSLSGGAQRRPLHVVVRRRTSQHAKASWR